MSHLFLGRSLADDETAGSGVAHSTAPILAVDLDRCIACRACEVHCQLEHELPPEIRLMKVEPLSGDGTREPLAFPFGCAHCRDAPCVAVCPTGAMHRREDGIVLLDEPRCIGCRFCIVACPYGAPQYDARRGKVVKCDLCVARLAEGLWPACATKCVMKAIHLLDAERFGRVLGEGRRRGAGAVALGVSPAGGAR